MKARIRQMHQRLFSPAPGRGVNGRVLLLCFVISGISWLTLTLQQSFIIHVDLPLKITEVPPDLQVTFQSDSFVTIELRGEGYSLLWQQIRWEKDTLRVPYAHFGKDESCALEPEWLSAWRQPGESMKVRAEIQSPRSLRIQSEEKITKTVALRLRGEINLESAYKLEGLPRLEPDSVQVQGPENILDTLSAWHVTGPFTRPLSKDTTLRVQIADTLADIRISPLEATAFIYPRRYTQIEVSVPIEIRGVPAHVKVRLSKPDIQLACLVPMDSLRYKEAFSEVRRQKVVVKYSELDERFPYFTPQFSLPDGIIPIAWSPRQVSFVILQK